MRNATSRFLSAVLGGAVLVTPLLGAEPASPGMRQQPVQPRPGAMQNPMNIPHADIPRADNPRGGMRQPPMVPEDGLSRPFPGQPPAQPPNFSRPALTGSPATEVTHRGTRYVISDGHWYEQRGADLVATTPPAGVLVQDLPQGYAMRWVGGVPYFYADGLYYVWRERSRRYEILQAPPAGNESVPAQPRVDTDRDAASLP